MTVRRWLALPFKVMGFIVMIPAIVLTGKLRETLPEWVRRELLP